MLFDASINGANRFQDLKLNLKKGVNFPHPESPKFLQKYKSNLGNTCDNRFLVV